MEFKFLEVDEMPRYKDREPGTIYVCNEPINGLGFLCPCGCGIEVYLPFKPSPSPSWEYDPDSGTVAPSIQQRGGCKSHYFIRAGKVVWA